MWRKLIDLVFLFHTFFYLMFFCSHIFQQITATTFNTFNANHAWSVPSHCAIYSEFNDRFACLIPCNLSSSFVGCFLNIVEWSWQEQTWTVQNFFFALTRLFKQPSWDLRSSLYGWIAEQHRYTLTCQWTDTSCLVPHMFLKQSRIHRIIGWIWSLSVI